MFNCNITAMNRKYIFTVVVGVAFVTWAAYFTQFSYSQPYFLWIKPMIFESVQSSSNRSIIFGDDQELVKHGDFSEANIRDEGMALTQTSSSVTSSPSSLLSSSATATRPRTDQSTEDATDAVQQVSRMLKTQLEMNTTMQAFSVKTPCHRNKPNERACIYQDCIQLSDNITTRVESLMSEKTMLTKAQDDLLRSISVQIPENDVIIVSAASSNHYAEMQAMFHSLHTMVLPELSKRENFSMVLWDIGLSPTKRNQTEQCCRCQVVSFPFEKFPDRVRDRLCYMWKPLIIRMTLLRARKYVVWQDASIRYNSYPGEVYERGMRYGLQFLQSINGGSIPHRTLPETFSYYGQQICSFYQYPELYATFGVYKSDPFVLTAVTNPWARCAFEQTCMCPSNTWKSLVGYYGPRHRFDQSALSVVTTTLYSSEIYRILTFEENQNCISIRRGDTKSGYFKSTGCPSN